MHRLLIPALLLFLYGCATPAPADGVAASASKVTIHESQTDVPRRYEILKRLWTESLASATWVPYYDTVDEAKAAFRAHAESMGGDAVINFGCYPLTGGLFSRRPLACNGTIVRYL